MLLQDLGTITLDADAAASLGSFVVGFQRVRDDGGMRAASLTWRAIPLGDRYRLWIAGDGVHMS